MPLDSSLRDKYLQAYAAAVNDERLSFEEWLIAELERVSSRTRFDGERLHDLLTKSLDWVPADAKIRPKIIQALARPVPPASTTDVLPHLRPEDCPSYFDGCRCREVLEHWGELGIGPWIDLTERVPHYSDRGGDTPVLLWMDPSRLADDCPAHCHVVSNPAYAAKNALKAGYTHWAPLPPGPSRGAATTRPANFRPISPENLPPVGEATILWCEDALPTHYQFGKRSERFGYPDYVRKGITHWAPCPEWVILGPYARGPKSPDAE